MHRRRSPAASGGVSAVPGRGPGRRFLAILTAAIVLLPVTLAGCFPQASNGSLPATLSLREVTGGSVAMQDGIPVPTFDAQPRETLDLSGRWRYDRMSFDSNLTMADRRTSLPSIVELAGNRQQPDYDDSHWAFIAVPGSTNPPPDQGAGSAWYRRQFDLPATWTGQALTLKFGAANYVADVWLNGHYLGYHEGGSTPFAFDISAAAKPDAVNLLAVRVDSPAWGTRDDIVPWGLADWWNYGGLTQPVWIEATPPLLVDRADVVPHLDGADISITIENRKVAGSPPAAAGRGKVFVDVLPTAIDSANILDSDPYRLVPLGAEPLATKELPRVNLGSGGVAVLGASIEISGARLWSIGKPNLYVLRVRAIADDGETDELYASFGLRHVAVDPEAPRVLLNGSPTFFTGVAVHDEKIARAGGRAPYAAPITTAAEAYSQLLRAQQVNATLVRTAHEPSIPLRLMLADRLGLAIWEEIPLYHYTPLTFQAALGRGIPQQMLREMALRDMNRPSVLFYGLANESTGATERADAMATLARVAKEIDGTRLTGQASFGIDSTDMTSAALDVVGFTYYFGVFYGDYVVPETQAALTAAHRRYPKKPLMILEFGHWADPPAGQAAQTLIMDRTQSVVGARSDARPGGYVAGSVWWSLEDYYTMRPGITVERFGLFDPHGSARPVVASATRLFGKTLAEAAPAPLSPAERGQPQVVRVVESSGATWLLAGYVGYGLLVSTVLLAAMLALSMVSHGRWSKPVRRRRRAAGEGVPR